ncbi:hypothetical protein [Butyrivibrio fibrisolvens]|uniref:hypothetical protein n=1 Tax=Butyrivibrio fibrisolvens TaxID=831 RepID=UPI000485D8D7|nr:hypothetical protein [Butyrivibrio fibrisolvens]
MDDYKFSVGIEPEDAYKKARKDMIQALQSTQRLTPVQRQKLAEELFGAAAVSSIIQLLNNYHG